MVYIDMVELTVGAAAVGIIGFFAGTLWGIRGMSQLLADLYAVECERDYYRDLVPERDKSGRFIKKENIDA